MKCERCGKPPEGELGLHNYCERCSQNLCPSCMVNTPCEEAIDGHRPAQEEEEEGDRG